MEFKSSVGICTKVQDSEGKLVIVPQDSEIFEENQVVVLISANDLECFTDEIKSLVKFVQSVQTISDD